jgi:hypothetical protein
VPAFGALKSGAQAVYVCPDALVNAKPCPHQHPGAGRETAYDLSGPDVSPNGRPHVLWTKQRGPVPACSRLC